MPSPNMYRNYQTSLIRFCRDFGDAYSLGFVNMDAHADATQWPEGDFIGLGEFNVVFGQPDEVMLAFAISTKGDSNLLRMSDLTNALVDLVLPTSRLPLYDADTGQQIAGMTVAEGVKVGAPLPTESQPVQPIMLRLLSDHASF